MAFASACLVASFFLAAVSLQGCDDAAPPCDGSEYAACLARSGLAKYTEYKLQQTWDPTRTADWNSTICKHYQDDVKPCLEKSFCCGNTVKEDTQEVTWSCDVTCTPSTEDGDGSDDRRLLMARVVADATLDSALSKWSVNKCLKHPSKCAKDPIDCVAEPWKCAAKESCKVIGTAGKTGREIKAGCDAAGKEITTAQQAIDNYVADQAGWLCIQAVKMPCNTVHEGECTEMCGMTSAEADAAGGGPEDPEADIVATALAWGCYEGCMTAYSQGESWGTTPFAEAVCGFCGL